jgi:hypothetical protein
VTTDVLALVNGGFQRMTPETSFPKGSCADKKCQRVQKDARRSSGRSGNAWPFAFGALQKFEKSTAKIRKEHRAFA